MSQHQGYNYDKPQKLLTNGGSGGRYPGTSTSADYPSAAGKPQGPKPSGNGHNGYPSGKPSGSAFPGSQGSFADYPTAQGPSPVYGPPGSQGQSDAYPSTTGSNGAASGAYPGAQRPGQNGGSQGGYPGAQGPSNGGSQGGYPGSQRPQGQNGHPAADTPVGAGFPGAQRPVNGGHRPGGAQGEYPAAQGPANGGTQGGYPPAQGPANGGSQGGYPSAQGPANGGSQGGYPGAQGPANGGSQGGYPSVQGPANGGSQGGYPGVQGSANGGAQGGYPGAQGGQNGGAGNGKPGQGFGGQGGFSLNEQGDGSNDDGDYSAIPGQPEVDYPIFSEIPQTAFRCDQQQFPGYYADVEARCQVFHICANNLTYDFLCPNGTIFHQQHFVCVWWNQFDCSTAESLYGLNANIYDYSKTGASQDKGYPGTGIIGVQHPNDYPQGGNQNGGQAGQGQGGYPGASGKPQGPSYPEGGQQGYPQQKPTNGNGHHQGGQQSQGYPRPEQQGHQNGYPSAPGQEGYPQQQKPTNGFHHGQSTGNGHPQGTQRPAADQYEHGQTNGYHKQDIVNQQQGGYPQHKPSGSNGNGYNKPQQQGHAEDVPESHGQGAPTAEYGTPSGPQSDHHQGSAQGYPSGRPNGSFPSGAGFPASQADTSFDKPNREYLPPRNRRMSQSKL